MMNTVMSVPSEIDLDILKKQVEEVKRANEYAELKKELQNMQQLQVDQSKMTHGAIQSVDEHQLLKTKRTGSSVFEKVFIRIGEMASPASVTGSISAIVIGIVCLTILYYKADALGLKEYQHFLGFGILIAGAWQIVKSGSRSLFLPIIAVIVGFAASSNLNHGYTFLSFSKDFYNMLTLVGIAGLINSMTHMS